MLCLFVPEKQKEKNNDKFKQTKNARGTQGTIIFFRWGSQIYKKSASIKLGPPYFGNKNFITLPSPIHLTPKQAKIVLKSIIFLNKINTLSVVILWCPTYWSSKILWPLIFLSKIYDSPHIFWTPPSKENDSPLKSSALTLNCIRGAP